MALKITYYYRKSALDTPQGVDAHDQIRNLLSLLQAAGRIAAFSVEEADVAFPTEEAKRALLDRLREFAMRHKAGLARAFGSRKHSFWYLPQQFLLVAEGNELREVFPCRIGDGDVEPLEFLVPFEQGRPWTVRSGGGMEGKKHKLLVAQILERPDALEPGLTFRGKDIQVSLDFGEEGFVDLVFEDGDGKTLLVEVKVKPDELDKAIGQIMRHRHLFARQNYLEESSIRIGITCPYIAKSCRAI